MAEPNSDRTVTSIPAPAPHPVLPSCDNTTTSFLTVTSPVTGATTNVVITAGDDSWQDKVRSIDPKHPVLPKPTTKKGKS